MIGFRKYTATALGALMIAAAPMAASALSLSFSGFSVADTIPGNFDLNAVTGLSTGDSLTVFDSAHVGGLKVSDPTTIKVTYLGSEAGNNNQVFELTAGGALLFDNNTSSVGDMASFVDDGDFIDFLFRDNTDNEEIENGNTGVAPTGLRLAFSDISADGRSVIALFGDGAGDTDFDDIAVRISAIPVPAAGIMLLTALGGLGGVGALRRRRKAA